MYSLFIQSIIFLFRYSTHAGWFPELRMSVTLMQHAFQNSESALHSRRAVSRTQNGHYTHAARFPELRMSITLTQDAFQSSESALHSRSTVSRTQNWYYTHEGWFQKQSQFLNLQIFDFWHFYVQFCTKTRTNVQILQKSYKKVSQWLTTFIFLMQNH